jgi:hypothetical protein
VNVVDPVASGIVSRLNQPGGNITGFALFEGTLGGKWLELLSEIAPGLKRAVIMFNPDFPVASTYMPSLETAARSLKVEPITAPVYSDAEIETAITAPGSAAAGGIALINSIGNLGGFAGPYAIGWIKDATDETTLGLVALAACPIMAGVVTFLMGHDSKIELAGSRMMAE